AIWADKSTRVIVQGITGREGTFDAKQCREYGTNVVGGVTPGKGGTTHEGFAVFNSVREAREKEGANCSLIFVPPPFAADAIMESADAGIELIICITEGIPVNDMMRAHDFLRQSNARAIAAGAMPAPSSAAAKERRRRRWPRSKRPEFTSSKRRARWARKWPRFGRGGRAAHAFQGSINSTPKPSKWRMLRVASFALYAIAMPAI